MATKNTGNILSMTEKQVDDKSTELVDEFYAHFEEYTKLHPEDRDKKDEIFHGWVIQKIAGLQLSILHISERINRFINNIENTK
jgi:hypothetical protein